MSDSDDQIRVRRPAIIRLKGLRVFSFDFFAVAVVPPIVHSLPWPLRHIENVIAENGHAFVEPDLDPVSAVPMKRHGDDANDDSERSERRTRLVRAHLRHRDFPAFVKFVEKPLHVGLPATGDRASGLNPV